MSANVISIGYSKGGAGATTLTYIVAYILSLEHKVLAIDCSPLGNLSDSCLGESVTGHTVYEALLDQDPWKHIVTISKNHHILPSGVMLTKLPEHLYQVEKPYLSLDTLKNLVDKLRTYYDYIIIDLPTRQYGSIPSFGLVASDYLVLPAIPDIRILDLLERSIKHGIEHNKSLKVLGIIYQMAEYNVTSVEVERLLRNKFRNTVLDQVIMRKATAREAICGLDILSDLVRNRKIDEGYFSFVKEIKRRMKD